jgi:hypothetical protein
MYMCLFCCWPWVSSAGVVARQPAGNKKDFIWMLGSCFLFVTFGKERVNLRGASAVAGTRSFWFEVSLRATVWAGARTGTGTAAQFVLQNELGANAQREFGQNTSINTARGQRHGRAGGAELQLVCLALAATSPTGGSGSSGSSGRSTGGGGRKYKDRLWDGRRL